MVEVAALYNSSDMHSPKRLLSQYLFHTQAIEPLYSADKQRGQDEQQVRQCLNCSKPCPETTIFCDECRTSLLKRQQPGARHAQQAKPSARHARILKRLHVFLILGVLSLVTGSILLTANILQHHNSSLMDMVDIAATGIVLSPHNGSGTWPGKPSTPTLSPVAGTTTSTFPGATPGINTGTVTATGISGTTTPVPLTPAPGTATPAPTSIPGTTPTTAPNDCTLQVAPAHLSFTATALQPDPPGQTVTLKATDSCGKPVMWKASANASWIQLSTSSASDNGSGSILTVSAHSNHVAGIYNAHITFTAVDSNGITLQNSPQTISVTLTILG